MLFLESPFKGEIHLRIKQVCSLVPRQCHAQTSGLRTTEQLNMLLSSMILLSGCEMTNQNEAGARGTV